MNRTPKHNHLPPHDLQTYCAEGRMLEVYIERCDSAHNLHGTLFGCPAVIERAEAISPRISGAHKEISVLSLVGKRVCCAITDIETDSSGNTTLHLSRRRIQEDALAYLLSALQPGDLLPAVITSMSTIGVFADIGCGVIALLPIQQISVSRIRHPRERFSLHQQIPVLIDRIDPAGPRFLLSHKELLGTWEENAAAFHPGETVTGIVRGIKPYGIFIELAPNLTGLAETEEPYSEGQRVSVLIKTIADKTHKIKLHIIAPLPPEQVQQPLRYFIPMQGGASWQYKGE